MEFAVQMTCQRCVDDIKRKLDGAPGLHMLCVSSYYVAGDPTRRGARIEQLSMKFLLYDDISKFNRLNLTFRPLGAPRNRVTQKTFAE